MLVEWIGDTYEHSPWEGPRAVECTMSVYGDWWSVDVSGVSACVDELGTTYCGNS